MINNKIIVGIIIVIIILAIILIILTIRKKSNKQQSIPSNDIPTTTASSSDITTTTITSSVAPAPVVTLNEIPTTTTITSSVAPTNDIPITVIPIINVYDNDVYVNGVLNNDFAVMLKNMDGNYYNDVTSGQWKLIKRNPNITKNFWIFLTKITADKISIDPHISPISTSDTAEVVAIKNNLIKNMAIDTGSNMFLYYAPVSTNSYALGTYSAQAVPVLDTTMDLSKVVNIDKVILYKYGVYVHMIKIASSSNFENIFGNYAEYYLYSAIPYGASTPASYGYFSGKFYMVGSGEYK